MSWLLDTNVLSELRKRERCNPNVAAWFAEVLDDDIYLSVLVIGEIRRGIESIRRRDARAASSLELWLRRLVADHEDRILPVDQRIAEEWGRISVPSRPPSVDGLLAATARVHGLTLVTRNVADVRRTGVLFKNPFLAIT